MAALCIIKLRHSSIIWMFHNIRPHQGENWMTRNISNWLFRNSTMIVAHSQEAAEYARNHANCMVEYRCHPIEPINVDAWTTIIEPFDLFIWGSILPYKGVLEFVSLPKIQSSNLRIKIIGSCKDKTIDYQLSSCINEHIVYENGRADFAEIAANCKAARFVLFPYIGDCVSSSGALVDTIVLGGTPLGPNIAAFKDLAEDGICITYTDYENLMEMLTTSSEAAIRDTDSFIKSNTWDQMGKFIYDKISLYRSKSKIKNIQNERTE